MSAKKKTTVVTSTSDWMCPVHGVVVENRIRTSYDKKTAKRKYAGEYFACPSYHECKYYVSPNGTIPVLGEES